jgi:hypothetical protein
MNAAALKLWNSARQFDYHPPDPIGQDNEDDEPNDLHADREQV